MAGNIHVVKTADEFYQALQVAQGGDRIELAPGAYGDIQISRVNFDSEVIITSQDTDTPATFNTVMLSSVSNLTFDNIFFDFTPDENTVEWHNALRVDNSSNITVINSRFEGGPSVAGVPIDSEPGTQGAAGIEGMPIGRAMSFNWSENIVIENNDISQFTSGVRFNDVNHVTFNSNEIYDFRKVPVGGADVSNLTMENNYFHDANPWKFGGLGDHGDFVHFWTSGPDAPVSENHYYAGNIFDQGDGVALLGIYLDDNLNKVGFRNITIENNLIYNGNTQAILMENVDGLHIRDNTLLQSSGDEKDAPLVRLIDGSKNVVVENNIFGGINGSAFENADINNIVIGENVIVQIHDPHAANYYGAVFVSNAQSVFDIRAIPGGVADGIGSTLTQFDWAPATLTPQFQVYSDAASAQAAIFDASLTVGPQGLVAESDAEFLWTFGDGSTAAGQVVKHHFAAPGFHDVTLTVTGKDGATAQAKFTAGIAGSEIVQFDAQLGLFEALAFGEETPLDSGVLPLLKSTEGYALKLGGDGTQAKIAASELSRFFGTDAFELSMSLKADSAASWGEIARIHTSFTVGVDQSGNLVLELFLEDGSRLNIASKGIFLNDGARHDVSIRFDGALGNAAIVVDGNTVASESVSGSLFGGARSLDFGNPWGRQNFDGELSAFSLSADSRDFPVYSGEVDPISENTTNDLTPIVTEENTTVAPDVGDTDETSITDPVGVDDGGAPNEAPIPEEDSGVLKPLLQGGYTLDFAAIATSDTIKLHDDAHVIDGPNGLALSFDGKRDFVELGRLTEFEASQKIAFSVDFTSENTTNRAERLVWNHEKIGISLEGDGVRVHVGNTSSKFDEGFLVTGLGLNDGNQHSAIVMVDAETDRLQFIVDDVLVLDKEDVDFDFVGAGGHEWGWSLGTSWNRWFEGEVHEFQVSDDFSFVETQAVDGDLLI